MLLIEAASTLHHNQAVDCFKTREQLYDIYNVNDNVHVCYFSNILSYKTIVRILVRNKRNKLLIDYSDSLLVNYKMKQAT